MAPMAPAQFLQFQQQINQDIEGRIAAHKTKMAAAKATRAFVEGAANRPLVLLADGDSWFDYPLGDPIPGIRTDILAQLPKISGQEPNILSFAHYGDATNVELGLTRQQRMVAAIQDPGNGPIDAILFSGGGNDIVGDQFCIWLKDASSVGNDPAQALDATRFPEILGAVEASYLDLIALRDDNLPNAFIFTHGYDFAIPSGDKACGIGPWLMPSLQYCGWGCPNPGTQIVKNALLGFSGMLKKLAGDPAKKFVYIETQGTLTDPNQWDNELHPKPDGFTLMARKFLGALRDKFGARI